MVLIQTSLIWVTYAVAIAILLAIASIFVYTYQASQDRSASVTTVCIFTITCLLATLLLLPVDVALVSSTVRSSNGTRKDWASQDKVDSILFTLKIVYYTLYSLDAVLCLLVIPFTYFLYEEYDEREAEEGEQTVSTRLWGAFKYTIIFILIVVILFVVGFFVPVARYGKKHKDLNYFKDLLAENRQLFLHHTELLSLTTLTDGERALTFALGLLITIGTVIYVIYTASGLAILPVSLIKSAPSVSASGLAQNTASQLDQNRERQSQLEARNEGRTGGLDSRDQRELDALIREERTLIRRERLAAEAQGDGKSTLMRIWTKTQAIFRPVKLLGGLVLMVIAITIWVSMLITAIDKAKNSVCKTHCGYLLGNINAFQPINWIFVKSSKVFPIDYVLFILLALLLFSSSVVGIATVGIRFLWVMIFKIRKGHTTPQALLLATVMLTLIVLALNYSIAMIVTPQYATFGPQTFCDRPFLPGEQADCSTAHNLIKHCTELALNETSRNICTPSVMSTFINRIVVNFPFFGVFDFWAQFAFLGMCSKIYIVEEVLKPSANTLQASISLLLLRPYSALRSSILKLSTVILKTRKRRAY